jgi:cyclase
MHSTLIVAKMLGEDSDDVARLFAEFDKTDMPRLMGTRRRQLFKYKGLYFHLQDFDSEYGGDAIEDATSHPLFKQISADLKPFITPYDPNWRGPSDAMATRFYTWVPR